MPSNIDNASVVGNSSASGYVSATVATSLGYLNFCIASYTGQYAVNAVSGDSVIRSGTRIHFSTGGNSPALSAYNNYIGVNVTSPAYTLDVNGTARVSGPLWFNNQLQNQVLCL